MGQGVQVRIFCHDSISYLDRIATVEKKVPESKVVSLSRKITGYCFNLIATMKNTGNFNFKNIPFCLEILLKCYSFVPIDGCLLHGVVGKRMIGYALGTRE